VTLLTFVEIHVIYIVSGVVFCWP